MLTIRQEKFISFNETGERAVVRAEIFVDTADELPEKDAISERILYQGSIAYVITKGELFVMDSSGNWHSSEGGEQL